MLNPSSLLLQMLNSSSLLLQMLTPLPSSLQIPMRSSFNREGSRSVYSPGDIPLRSSLNRDFGGPNLGSSFEQQSSRAYSAQPQSGSMPPMRSEKVFLSRSPATNISFQCRVTLSMPSHSVVAVSLFRCRLTLAAQNHCNSSPAIQVLLRSPVPNPPLCASLFRSHPCSSYLSHFVLQVRWGDGRQQSSSCSRFCRECTTPLCARL